MQGTLAAQPLVLINYRQAVSSASLNGSRRAVEAPRVLCGFRCRYDIGDAAIYVEGDTSRPVDADRNEAILPNGCVVHFDAAGEVGHVDMAGVADDDYYLVLRLEWADDPLQAPSIHLVSRVPGATADDYQYENDLILAEVVVDDGGAIVVVTEESLSTDGRSRTWPIEKVGSQRGVITTLPLVFNHGSKGVSGTEFFPRLLAAGTSYVDAMVVIPPGCVIRPGVSDDQFLLTIWGWFSAEPSPAAAFILDWQIGWFKTAATGGPDHHTVDFGDQTVPSGSYPYHETGSTYFCVLQDVDVSLALSPATPPDALLPGDAIWVRISRSGDSASDTNAGVLDILAGTITVVRRQLGEPKAPRAPGVE